MNNRALSSHWFIAGILAFTLALSVGASSMRAYAEEGKSAASLADSVAVLTLGPSSETTATADGDYPAAFDLRDVDGHSYVTSVKFQNPFGTCWGFAAIAAAETSVLGSHFADNPEAYKALNFSEKQLAFFSHTHIDDPSNPQDSEGIYSIKYDLVDGKLVPLEPLVAEDYYTGGTPFLATNTFAAGAGPTQESKSEDLVYRGKEGKTINFADGTPFCYSNDDDWTLGEEYRFMQDYVLKESYMLPSPSDWTSGEYRYNEEGTNAIKEQLTAKRAVLIGFHADTSRPWDTGYGLYMDPGSWTHYTFQDPFANHAVTIVGWDDDFSASRFTHNVYQLADPLKEYDPSNFATDESGNYVVDEEQTALTTPPGNGAWLVKNSWGSGEEEFPNNGGGDWGIAVQKKDAEGNPVFDENGDPVMVGSGYFWLSYYDQTLQWPESFVFDTALTGEGGAFDQSTLHRNQYDLMPVTAMQAKQSDDLIKSANVFTPEDGEHLMCVSYITDTMDTEVTVDVYLLHDDFTSPEDGILVSSTTEARHYAGFYVDYLDGKPVHIQPGQSYSVVITQKQASGKYAVDYPTAFGPFNLAILLDMADYFALAVQNDESFLYSNGEWASWANEEARDNFLELYEETGMGEGFTQKTMEQLLATQYDNFPIKTYAFDRIADIFVRLAGDEKKLYVCVGEDPTTALLELWGDDVGDLTIEDFGNAGGVKIIDWYMVDGAEKLIELTPSEDGTQAQVKGLAVGTTYIVANVWDMGRVIIPVEVREHDWGAPTYTWADDNSTVTATRTCNYDSTHVETETVVPTSEVTKQPTTTAVGEATLTGTFTNPAFEPQTKDVELPMLEPETSNPPTPASKSETPKTGDGVPLGAVVVLLCSSALVLVACKPRSREQS